MRATGGSMAGPLTRADVTEREAEILWAVAERLRNREIAERLHVSVRTVESHIAALLRKLGAADRAALVETAVELRRAARTDIALPAPLTSLVGRDRETDELIALLEAHRLVTLIGPAGVGKTRLALHVAAVQADRFTSGIRFADLAPVQPELVGDALARALGVVPEPGWSLRDILREAAAAMTFLLIIDNCEHVVAQLAEIVADLLGAGQLRVLATSRAPLSGADAAGSDPARRRCGHHRHLRGRALVRRPGHDRVTRLHAHRRRRPGRRRAVPTARWTTTGHRARRVPDAHLRAG